MTILTAIPLFLSIAWLASIPFALAKMNLRSKIYEDEIRELKEALTVQKYTEADLKGFYVWAQRPENQDLENPVKQWELERFAYLTQFNFDALQRRHALRGMD